MAPSEPRSNSGNSADSPVFSVVICSINATKFRNVRDNYERLFAGVPIEIIGIHDARSLAEGYNRGIARAKGQYLILSHDDIAIITPDFATRLTAHLAQFDLVGVAGTTRLIGGAWLLAGHPFDYQLVASPIKQTRKFGLVIRGQRGLIIPSIQALDGVFMAMRMEVARKTPFDEATFDHFHLYDLDFSYRAFLGGYRLAVCRDLFIIHQSGGRYDATWEEHRRRFEAKFAGRLESNTQVIKSPMTRVQFDAEALNDEDSVRWLCDPASILSLIARLETPEA